MTTTYSKDGDVSEKLANIKISSDIVIDNFRKSAYNRINARLRKLYVVPVVSTDDIDIAILKSIEANITAGRILIAVATLHEVENVSEYGKLLIQQGESELKDLTEEIIVLSTSAERDADDSDEAVNPPLILGSSADEYSTFDRPMSGIENDAIEGKVDAEEYSELYDIKTL